MPRTHNGRQGTFISRIRKRTGARSTRGGRARAGALTRGGAPYQDVSSEHPVEVHLAWR